MTLEQVVNRMQEKPYMLEMGKNKLSKWLKCSKEDIVRAKNIVRNSPGINHGKFTVVSEEDYYQFTFKKKPKNILVIADTHLPYEKKGYLEFCKEQYDKYDCDTVIHIGDLIDAHTTSRHPSIPEAYSPGDELRYSIKKLKKWYNTFPEMKVCIGNHDIRAHRAAIDGRIAAKWIKGFAEVLEVPNWNFEESFEINDIIFTHGTGTSGMSAAYKRALNAGKSIVMGHLHSEASIMYHKFPDRTVYGMIVGCGVDMDSYGMNYAKNYPKQSIISCGVILDGDPMIKIMK